MSFKFKKAFLSSWMIFVSLNVLFGQEKDPTPTQSGFRHLEISIDNELVQVLVKSKNGEEGIKKPLFLFCEGSLPQPTFKHDGKHVYGVFPFDTIDFINDYHLVIINKPGIPLIGDERILGRRFMYKDSTGLTPIEFNRKDHLDYYTRRNIKVLAYLLEQDWTDNKQLVVAGHSQGSIVAVDMASKYEKITHLIYSGGSPLGRILKTINQLYNGGEEQEQYIQGQLDFWKKAVSNKNDSIPVVPGGITYRNFYSFSKSQMDQLISLKIPVLVTYGTRDANNLLNEYLRIKTIEYQLENYSFIPYSGKEHNYFDLKEDGEVDYETYNWPTVGKDWMNWLKRIN